MTHSSDQTARRALEVTIRVGAALLLVVWCAHILLPFLVPVLWGAIIAVAVGPVHQKLAGWLGRRPKLAAALLSLAALALLLVPSVLLAISLSGTVQEVSVEWRSGTFEIPAPPDGLSEWPLVGEALTGIWQQAHEDLPVALERWSPEIESLGLAALSGAGAGVVQVLMFAFSLVVTGLLLAFSEGGGTLTRKLGRRLAGARGDEFADLAIATIRSVAKGVIGVAVIQALLSALGMVVAGVPAPGVWALLVLVLAVIQLPPLLVMLPVVIWYFGEAETLPAVLFAAWTGLVMFCDTALKPLLFGRGMDIPVLVILLGATGGMVTSGIIGLFVGAVVLALGYKLFLAWLDQGDVAEASAPGA